MSKTVVIARLVETGQWTIATFINEDGSYGGTITPGHEPGDERLNDWEIIKDESMELGLLLFTHTVGQYELHVIQLLEKGS